MFEGNYYIVTFFDYPQAIIEYIHKMKKQKLKNDIYNE